MGIHIGKGYRPSRRTDIKELIYSLIYLLVHKYDENPYSLNLKSIEEIVDDYIFTADNFIKMILILLREEENVSIILMGETGCGKTALVRKLSEQMNNYKDELQILNIHAGITTQDIIFLFNNIIYIAKYLEESERIIQEEYKRRDVKYTKKELWVFFDNINSSSNCLTLINEIMTKHSCKGIKLPDNIFFIGAFHPFRYGKKVEEYCSLRNNRLKERKLIYSVNPLPFSLLNFVVNFGIISP